MKFLDPVTLTKLSHLQVRVRHVVEGVLSGLHASPCKGHSLEFAEHREYARGDELRHIDWKVYGRSDKFFVKQFQDETNLRASLLLDASGSMGFSSARNVKKLEYGAFLAGAISYLLLRQEDAVSLGVFGDHLRSYLPPSNKRSHLPLILGKLEGLAHGGETKIGTIVNEFAPHVKRRSLIIVISDLMDEPAHVLRALKYFRFRHHEVMVVQVLDPDEIKFSFSGEKTFAHLESSSEISADADMLRTEYHAVFQQFLNEYKSGFRQAGIDYHLVTTDIPIERTLGTILAA